MKRILLYSGGLDSFIAWHYLGFPERLYVELGTKYCSHELDALEQGPTPSGIIIRDHHEWGRYECEDAWLPMRNMLLVMIAVAEGADIVYLVAQKGEQSIPDRSPRFFKMMSEQMTIHNKRDIVVDPVFPNLTKVQMVRWYLDQGLDPIDLVYTFSCYSDNPPCGYCGACWRKFIALEYSEVHCEHIFKHNIRAYGEHYYLPKLDTYDEDRKNEMKKVMGW